jgi:hypothetical protein
MQHSGLLSETAWNGAQYWDKNTLIMVKSNNRVAHGARLGVRHVSHPLTSNGAPAPDGTGRRVGTRRVQFGSNDCTS